MKEIVKFQNVCKYYGDKDTRIAALDHVNFSIYDAQLTVILGPSGAGKSTLLNVLGGMNVVDEGDVFVGDQCITNLSEVALANYRAQHIGFVFQFYNLIHNLTAFENVALMKEVNKRSDDPRKVLTSVGLTLQQDKFPNQLSGGEQQRVAIARALVKKPTLLLCDEPTGALDSQTGKAVLKVLLDMVRIHKKSVIIVTHNNAIANIADRILSMKNGCVERIEVNEKPCDVDGVNW